MVGGLKNFLPQLNGDNLQFQGGRGGFRGFQGLRGMFHPLFLKFLPFRIQSNGDWIALFLPIHLALAYAGRRPA